MRAEGMSPLLALGLLVAGLCSSVHCLPEGGLDPEDVTLEDQHKGVPVDDHTFVSSNTDFAFSLYKQLALKTPNENVIFSPLSISMALAFLYLGARGPTLMEILEGLKFNLTKTPETEIHQGFRHLLQMLGRPSNQLQLSVGNAMFVQEQLKLLDKFREDDQALCASEAFSTDFRGSDTAKKLINDYVRNKAQGKVVEFFKDLDKLTEMILVNYIFFKARWKKPFDPSRTYKSEFHVSENRTVEAPMMTTGGLETPYFRGELRACTVVELKCTRNDSAPLILPDEGEMQDLEAELLPETLRRWRDSLQPRTRVHLLLPKFSISSDYDLQDILPQMRMGKVFPPAPAADQPGIKDAEALVVSQVVHSAVLDVDEEGSEGAAVMGSNLTYTTGEVITVHFNRPCMFPTLSKDTQSVIFLGKVTNLSQA
ncbi:LOW QUALITY PROTEIN: serpin A3-8-like [Balaenoptera musculus]|uniref:LOW QUALITY PROTEIN: serpin A3-8-like n=1 Tax=Balaenoptera musculus TaxID=9771 RepID=A0A8B8WLR7_BALMU|nr:LOW QUALITY PROTEIN: serpin A3-8-like [Balaenoptera musculus]